MLGEPGGWTFARVPANHAPPVRKVEAIRAALVEGEQSGIAEDSSIEGILSELRAARAP